MTYTLAPKGHHAGLWLHASSLRHQADFIRCQPWWLENAPDFLLVSQRIVLTARNARASKSVCEKQLSSTRSWWNGLHNFITETNKSCVDGS
jgi:hypothetical protein